MSKASPPVRRYWDACLFLDLVNRTPGRIEALANAWDDLQCEGPRAEAITSVLTIAEVAFSTQEKEVPRCPEWVDWTPAS